MLRTEAGSSDGEYPYRYFLNQLNMGIIDRGEMKNATIRAFLISNRVISGHAS